MSVALNGSTGYLVYPGKIANGFPFSIAIWVAGSTSVSNQVAIMQGQSNGDRYAMGWFTNFGGNKIADFRNPGTGNQALKNTSPDLSASTMRLMVLVYESATSRKVYFGSNVESTNATSMTDDVTSHDRVMIGAYQVNSAGSPSLYLNGSVAEAAVFNRALDDTDYDSLAGGALAETLSGCLACFPLRTATDLTSTNGTYTLTASGGVTTSGIAHPVTRGSPGPTISAHPSNQTVTAPATATFSVTAAATGGGSLSYQWQRSTNGGGAWNNVTTGSGGTTNSYTTAATSVSGGNANSGDQWRCVVTETGGSNAGSTNSNAATLTVNAGASGPTINTHPSNQTVTAPATASFSVTATTSGGALSYQWQRSTNGGGAWANVTTGTGGTSANYTTAATSVSGGNANNADQYRCNVTDSNGTTASNAATLTVNAAAGRITTAPIGNNSTTKYANTTGWTVDVYNATTGAFVVRKTGLTTDINSVITFTDALIVQGTNYACNPQHATYGARMPVYPGT